MRFPLTDSYKTLDYDCHHDILKEELPSVLESIGLNKDSTKGAKIVQITKTDKGYMFVELCDEYYGVTLSQEQMERFVKELQELSRLTPNLG